MQEEQTFYPVTTEYFTACLPLLEKYFGITAGYFNKELSNAKCLIPHREGNIVKYSIKEDCNLVLPFRHLECHDLLSLINSYGTITPIIEEALLLVAYCIREQQIDENEYNDLVQFHTWDIYQSEWAHLLLFMEQMEARTLKSNKQTAITIRTNNGEAEQISIPNSNNWLFRLIKKELAGNAYPGRGIVIAQRAPHHGVEATPSWSSSATAWLAAIVQGRVTAQCSRSCGMETVLRHSSI